MKNITPEQLEKIEYYAEDQYTLKDLFDELNISKKLMKDERVLQAFEKGLIRFYISMASIGSSDDEIINDDTISAEQCALWREQYSNEIKHGLKKKEDDERHATRQFSSPIQSGIVNIILQNGKDMPPISQQVLYEDINKMIQKIKSGDMETLLTILTTNILQLQLFNGTVTQNLMGDAGKQVDNFNKLSNMQLKVMQETRKSIMAINEIANPKRTTFIKEANQNNFIQENSEKKSLSQNEKQIEEFEIIPLKEKNNEYTL